jgi:hypothetical protein
MNIFVLSYSPQKCAQYHNDKHVVKMCLETTQLLNNALTKNDQTYSPIYRPTHVNHPASIWTGESDANFEWLLELGFELCGEYTHRYGKVHRCRAMIETMSNSPSQSRIPVGPMTPIRLCMPDEYKVGNAVQSYRAYYMGAKRHIAKWKNREVPDWWA